MLRLPRFSQALLCLVLLAIGSAECQSPAWAGYQNRSYDRGLRELGRRDYDGAINSFSQAIGLSMADPKLYFLRGQCFYNLHDYQKALTDFEHSLQLRPRNPEVLLWKGTVLSKMGEEKRSEQTYLTAMRINPQLVQQFKNGGGVEGSAVNPKNERAVRAYAAAAALYSAEGNCNNLPAHKEPPAKPEPQSSSVLTKPVRRIEDIDEAIRIDPNNPGLYCERAQTYERIGNLDRAIKDYSDAIKFNPMIAKYYLDRARCYHKQNKQTLCQSDIKKAQSVDPRVPRRIRFVDQ